MIPLLSTSPVEELPYRRLSLGTSFLYALVSAFFVGAELVWITQIARDGDHEGNIVFEVTSLVLWLAIGLRWGRGAWECTKRQATQEKQGGTV